jgi:Fe-S-cluster-containing hydrogenase component 2
MGRPLWFVKLLKKAFPGRFFLARSTHIEPVGRLIKRWFFEGDDLAYLPINLRIPVDESPAEHRDYVLPEQVIDHFIQNANYLWIMDECICRSSSGCESYPTELGCLFLGEAAMGINPDMGRPVSILEALSHVEWARREGLVHLIGRNKIDTVWLGVGPGHKLLTICSCCPCCCLWRMHPHLTPAIRASLHRMPGISVSVTDDCSGCGLCLEDVCFVSAIEMIDERAVVGDACLACGRCVSTCPDEAIVFKVEDVDFIQSTIERISPLVNLS